MKIRTATEHTFPLKIGNSPILLIYISIAGYYRSRLSHYFPIQTNFVITSLYTTMNVCQLPGVFLRPPSFAFSPLQGKNTAKGILTKNWKAIISKSVGSLPIFFINRLSDSSLQTPFVFFATDSLPLGFTPKSISYVNRAASWRESSPTIWCWTKSQCFCSVVKEKQAPLCLYYRVSTHN